jgi:hypothetical protein
VLALRSWLAGGLSELDHQLAIPQFVEESGDGACNVVSDSEAATLQAPVSLASGELVSCAHEVFPGALLVAGYYGR